jgi:uncharacterized LabA/DUF88 family protein
VSDQLALFIDFENVAIWAEENFFDLELGLMLKFLQSRGPVVVKRAYGDWSRFAKYRDDLLENSVDLVQMYSVRHAKNRADIRLALDAFETAINRPQITTIVIVSGDSDFGALASKLREYGRYILGIGPRSITHPLLVKSCDEFVYMENLLGQEPDSAEGTITDRKAARNLLTSALSAYERRGELPVMASLLKQTLLSMDPTFNETNLGYGQLRTWLEDNKDLVKLLFKGFEMYVAPLDFQVPQQFAPPVAEKQPEKVGPAAPPKISLTEQYVNVFSKTISIDRDTRHDLLRDIYREISEKPNEWSLGALVDELHSRYESKGSVRSKTTMRKLLQSGFHQHTFEYSGSASFNVVVRFAKDVDSQAAFIRRIEARFPYVIIKNGLDIDLEEMASILVYDRSQTGYIQELLEDLEKHSQIRKTTNGYRLPGKSENPLLDDPQLKQVIRDINSVRIPEELKRDITTARELAKNGMAKRSTDFATSARDFLLASRLTWDALAKKDAEATLDDLRWYIASYASVKAGEISQTQKKYAQAKPYYLAFFSLVEEETPLWERMRGLINPMLSFYWRNLALEMNQELEYTTSPIRIAVLMANHTNLDLKTTWLEATHVLADINPDVLKRVAENIRMSSENSQASAATADLIEQMLENTP